MKQNYSLINRFSLGKILLLFILLIVIDVLNLSKAYSTSHPITDTAVWFPCTIGILLISFAFVKITYKTEKIGIIFLGVAFILSALAKLLGYRLFMYFPIGLEILALYCFYLSKTSNQMKS